MLADTYRLMGVYFLLPVGSDLLCSRCNYEGQQTYVLVDQHDSDVGALSEFLECSFNGRDLRLCMLFQLLSENGRVYKLESTIKKFFLLCWFICPTPASKRPVIVS